MVFASALYHKLQSLNGFKWASLFFYSHFSIGLQCLAIKKFPHISHIRLRTQTIHVEKVFMSKAN